MFPLPPLYVLFPKDRASPPPPNKKLLRYESGVLDLTNYISDPSVDFSTHPSIAVQAKEYSLARLCMDDLLAECIALKGFRQGDNGSGGGRPQAWTDHHPQPTRDVAATSASPPPTQETPHPTTTAAAAAAAPASASAPTPAAAIAAASATSPDAPTPAVAAAAAAAAAAVSVASNLPDGEYPPETGSLRIIGENFGCVVDVVGETAADAAVAAVVASTGASGASGGILRAVGSATPVGHQDVLIWGPVGAVGEAKDAVAALVSGNACAEVVVGTGRIKRRDRGFWVNCEVRSCWGEGGAGTGGGGGGLCGQARVYLGNAANAAIALLPVFCEICVFSVS